MRWRPPPWRERRLFGVRLIDRGIAAAGLIRAFEGHLMRMPRTTIRSLMAIVLLIGVAIWAGLAAERTRSNKARFHTHFHANGVPHDPNGEFAMTPAWIPFWPVYWRTLLGLPWNWHYACVPGSGRRKVVCERDFPQIFVLENGKKSANFSFEHLQAAFDGQSLQ